MRFEVAGEEVPEEPAGPRPALQPAEPIHSSQGDTEAEMPIVPVTDERSAWRVVVIASLSAAAALLIDAIVRIVF